jgi:glycosyltransferase involved in cell wall biosynthesis
LERLVRVPKEFENLNSYSSFNVIDFENFKAAHQKSDLKLSVITEFFPPDFAATGQLIEELVKHLSLQGMDIKVFTGQPGYAFQTAKAPEYEAHKLLQIKRSRTTQLCSKRVRDKAISGVLFMVRSALHLVKNCRRRDLVLLTTAPPFLPLLGYFANLFLGMRYVCLLYDLYPDVAIELGVVSKQHWISKLWREVNRRVWRRAENLIVLSEAMKQRVVNHCPEVADKIQVIHSWADHKQIVPIEKADNWFAQEHELVEPFTVLYSGNMGRCHDIDTIFEAMMQLRDQPIKFVCIGNGAKREELKVKAKQYGLDNVLFLPYQSKEVLPYSLTACDLSLVSVSPGMESLVAPSKLYSALASGRPIAAICPPHTYLRPMLQDSGCGAWFDNGESGKLADFILHLSQERSVAQAMGKAARAYLEENFTPEIIAQQYFKVLHGQSAVSPKENRVTRPRPALGDSLS